MIQSTFNATSAQTSATLRSIERSQRELADKQLELSSGKKADIARDLGAGTRSSISLREERSHLGAIKDGNSIVATRLQASEVGLGQVATEVDQLLKALVASSSGQADGKQLVEQARNGLASIESALNSSVDGTPLFSGTRLTAKPFAPYFSDPSPPSRQSTSTAFANAFSMSANDPAVSSISTASAMSFVDTAFSDLFADPAWGTAWSAATDSPMQARISPNQVISTTPSANAGPIREVIKTFVMIGDLGVENMNAEARQAIITRAIHDLGGASQGVTSMRADLGRAASSVTGANEQMSATMHTIDRFISDKEDVDPAATSVRLTEISRDLEAAYALIARLSRLSLLDRL